MATMAQEVDNMAQLCAPSLDDIEAMARASFASLPETFRALTQGIVFMVQDFPDEEIMREMELESEYDLLGLFQGANMAMRESNECAPEPTMIFLYRRPILDYWVDSDEALGDIIHHVLVHEIGHHFGLSDEAMERIEGAES